MRARAFRQVDVFTAVAYRGNPVAVVLDADDLEADAMLAFTRWTNLSEATFIQSPSAARADYRLRIFTAGGELSFAGHPTLGSAHAWLEASGRRSHAGDTLVQECGAGLVDIRVDDGRLAFAAPPLRRSGPVAEDLTARIGRGLRVDAAKVRGMQWVDNGPGWIGVLLDSARSVLDLQIDRTALRGVAVGVIGPYSHGAPADFEVRAFFTGTDVFEDPVTGSLNASLAQWLISAGLAPRRYCVRQGTVLGRAGAVDITQDGERIWIGGKAVTCIAGSVTV